MTFAEFFNDYFDYLDMKTDFVSVFTAADLSGLDAIKDAYAKAISESQNDFDKLAELGIVLNHESAYWFQLDFPRSRLYGDMYSNVCAIVETSFTENEFQDFWEYSNGG